MISELVDPSMQMGKSKNRSLKCALVHFLYARHSKLSCDALTPAQKMTGVQSPEKLTRNTTNLLKLRHEYGIISFETLILRLLCI